MRRRELLLLLGGAMTAPRALSAQQKAMPVIGFFSSNSPGPYASYVAAFGLGLSQTGWSKDKMWRSNTAGQKVSMISCPHWPPTSSTVRSL